MLQIPGPTAELLCVLLLMAAEEERRGGGRPEEAEEAGTAEGPWADAVSGVWTESGDGAVVGEADCCNGRQNGTPLAGV